MELLRRKIQMKLHKKSAIYLIGSCVSQLFIFTINPGQIDPYKYLLASISLIFTLLLLWNIWFKEDKRNDLFIKVFVYIITFHSMIFIVSLLVGELIALICGIIILNSKLIEIIE